ncbi:uncharacterized protein ARMOST_12241 [Armillaria ostoyae]|uniref:Uncharacterized protein n=1 Tax=Armillaria ostoyae TaxID=47428 RepID=A0A284RJC6_ARMOS|nr:uncharacterized protein ARMOST_12241 [Armillaria ostoyae]
MDLPFNQTWLYPPWRLRRIPTTRALNKHGFDTSAISPSTVRLDQPNLQGSTLVPAAVANRILGSLPPIPTRHASSMNPPPPKLSSRQKETFYLTSIEGPIFNIHKTFATPIIRPDRDRDDSEADLLRFLERKPWADMRPDKLVCLGCGCDVGTRSPWSWLWHRNLCEGIDNAILRSVADIWEAEVAGLS